MGSGKPGQAARADCAAAVTPALSPKAPWRVSAVEIVAPWRLRVRFNDGVEGEVAFEPSFFQGVFAHLADTDAFAQVEVVHGAVTWPGELDLAPDAMHDEIAARGEWILN